MNAQPVVILGTRLFAEEVADLVAEIDGLRLDGFVENMDRARCAEDLNGLPVSWIDDAAPLADTHLAVCAFGTTRRDGFAEQAERLGFAFATVLHPTAWIAPSTTVGDGSIVSAGVLAGARASIGRHVVLNRGARVGHHTEIGDFCSLHPAANVCGACRLEDRVYVGAGAVIVDRVRLGSRAVVGAGAVVTRDVPEGATVVGVPARVIAQGGEGK